jgi:hypothetical protein
VRRFSSVPRRVSFWRAERLGSLKRDPVDAEDAALSFRRLDFQARVSILVDDTRHGLFH